MPTMTPEAFHTGGLTEPHVWDLSVLGNKAQYFFWDAFLDGMAERMVKSATEYRFYKYRAPTKNDYAHGIFHTGTGV